MCQLDAEFGPHGGAARFDMDDGYAMGPPHVVFPAVMRFAQSAGMAFQSPPSKNLGTWMDGDLYKVVLQRRLRMPLWPEACHCTACGAAMDFWGTMLSHAYAKVIGRCATTLCGTSHTMRHRQPGYSHNGRKPPAAAARTRCAAQERLVQWTSAS